MGTAALILISDGTEEMEFTIVYDTLVRAGVACTSAFVLADGASSEVTFATGSRGIKIVPDEHFRKEDAGPDRYDLLVIPGGATGAKTLSSNSAIQVLVREYLDKDKYVGMICAGSLAALTSSLPRQPLTSHPSVRIQLERDYDYLESPVVISGRLVTSRGPGTAFSFALTLAELLCGAKVRSEVREPMVFPEDTPW